MLEHEHRVRQTRMDVCMQMLREFWLFVRVPTDDIAFASDYTKYRYYSRTCKPPNHQSINC